MLKSSMRPIATTDRDAHSRDEASDRTDGRLSLAQRSALARSVTSSRLREYLQYESGLIRTMTGSLITALGLTAYRLGLHGFGLNMLSKVHRANHLQWANHVIEQTLKAPETEGIGGLDRRLVAVLEEYIAGMSPTPQTERFFRDPGRLLGSRAIVLKCPRENEKGVILIDLNFAFPLFAKLFDVGQVARRYYLVLEPGWVGYCNLEIICYNAFDFPVFVQATEPRDVAFIKGLKSNMVPVPLAANWWVDHRVMRPLQGIEKDVDLIMIACWGGYKRHHRFFAALRVLRERGKALKVVLIGYPSDKNLANIEDLARYYSVHDQIEFYESLSPEQVNFHLNRSKVNILWSRKEGFNRALIEAMLAGVPCVLREDFNYGFKYDYINEKTGCYSSEQDLPDTLLFMTENASRFAPREWVIDNMSPQRATAILNESIKRVSLSLGETWTEDIVVKVTGLHGQRYWDLENGRHFEPDYAFLRSMIRTYRD